MVTVAESMQCLSEFVAELYLKEQDFAQVLHHLSDDIIWIGASTNDVCLNKEEVYELLTKERFLCKRQIEHHSTWCKVRELSDNVCSATMLYVVQVNDTKEKMIRFSCIWRKENEVWKIAHVHTSFEFKGAQKVGNHPKTIIDYKIIEDICRASSTDTLTQIHNNQGFEKKAEEILHRNTDVNYVIVKFGVRNFRYINREYGYTVGDQVLISIAKNLTKMLHEDETCGRMEKDVFAILLKRNNDHSLGQRMYRIEKKLLSKTLVKKIDMEIQLAAGIYRVPKNSEEHIKAMTDKALIAMQNVDKKMRGSHYLYFEEWMLEQKYNNIRILNDAPLAMQNEEFKLYIQPQFDIKSRKVIAGEALVRWVLSDGSIRMPQEFIDVFERRGMILNFDFYMLEQVCKIFREWLDKGKMLYPISINQSRLHVEEDSYVEDFCAVVDKYKIPHHYLAIELTESAFVENSEQMLKIANHLHKEGFQLAIDDFGIGYATLNLLSVIAADILKIDKSLLNDFDTNKRSQLIMGKIIELAHQMNMVVICEGIETEEQLSYVQSLDCDIGQGFLIGTPVEAKQFEEKWLCNET